MHRPRFLRNDKLPLVAIAAGLVLIVVALIPWGDLFGHDNPRTTATFRPAIDTGLFPTEDPLTDLADGGESKNGQSGSSKDSYEALKNPFANTTGSNNPHTVTLRAISNGSMYVGYRYRDGKGDGRRVAGRSLTLTRTIRGTFPLAQIGVQVLPNATFAKCSISVDGVVVNSHTASGGGQITVCTG